MDAENFGDEYRTLAQRAAQWLRAYLKGDDRESCYDWLHEFESVETRELAAPHLERERARQ